MKSNNAKEGFKGFIVNAVFVLIIFVGVLLPLGRTTIARGRDAEYYKNRGVAYFNKGLYDKAIAEFNRALKLNPSYAEAYYSRGNAYANKRLYDKAIADYTKGLELDPSYLIGYRQRGNYYAANGLYEEAIEDFNRALEIYERDFEAYYKDRDSAYARYYQMTYAGAYLNRGDTYAAKGLYDKAIADYKMALKVYPDYEIAYFREAIANEKAGRIPEAIEAYNLYIQNANPKYSSRQIEHAKKRLRELGTKYDAPKQQVTEPRTAQSINGQPVKHASAGDWSQQGISFMKSERYDEAIEAFTRALEINPHDARTYLSRGRAWFKKSDYDKAIADCTKALEIDPRYANAYLRRGQAWYKKDDYDKAIADCTKALEINPDDTDACFVRWVAWRKKAKLHGVLYLSGIGLKPVCDNKKFQALVAKLEARIRGKKTERQLSTNVWLQQGISFMKSERYDEAIEAFTRALEINPHDAKTYLRRGAAWYKKDDYDKVIADCTNALEINPRYAEAYLSRGTVYHKKDDWDLAIADFTKALEINPRYTEAHYFRGNAWEQKGDVDLAIADFTKALEINPRYAEAYLSRGAVYYKKGDHQRALVDLKEAVRLMPKQKKLRAFVTNLEAEIRSDRAGKK